MKKQKLVVIAVIMMTLAFVFAACEGTEGPQGPQGPEGQGALTVWDSSDPPQLLGRFMTSGDGLDSLHLMTSKECIVKMYTTGGFCRFRILFFESNQAGDPFFHPGNWASVQKNTAFYNAHGGGTLYVTTGDTQNYDHRLDNPVKSYYRDAYRDDGGLSVNDVLELVGDTIFYKLRKTTPEEIGLPKNIVGPLVIK
jgi:hypothetical protein